MSPSQPGLAVVSGVTRAVNGRLYVVPLTIDPREERSDLRVELVGDDLPPADTRIEATGVLADRELRVQSWSSAQHAESAWEIDRCRPGVDWEVADEALHRLGEWDELLGVGVSTVADGRALAVVDVDRMTDRIRDWQQAYPPTATCIFAFITDA